MCRVLEERFPRKRFFHKAQSSRQIGEHTDLGGAHAAEFEASLETASASLRKTQEQQQQALTPDYSSICCMDCPSRFTGIDLANCYAGCARTCYEYNTCLAYGRGVYAAYCQEKCTNGFIGTHLVTPAVCEGVCASQAQTLCYNGCRDLFPLCYVDINDCLRTAPPKCNITG